MRISIRRYESDDVGDSGLKRAIAFSSRKNNHTRVSMERKFLVIKKIRVMSKKNALVFPSVGKYGFIWKSDKPNVADKASVVPEVT